MYAVAQVSNAGHAHHKIDASTHQAYTGISAARSAFGCLVRSREVDFVLMLTGCATPPQPPMQEPLLGTSVQQAITVEKPGCASESFELGNDKGMCALLATPGTVMMTRLRQPLMLRRRADTGVLASVESPSSRAATSGKSAAVGGAVGGGAVGAAVGGVALSFIPVLGVIAIATGVAAGAASGQAIESAQQPLQYPDHIVLAMECNTRSED